MLNNNSDWILTSSTTNTMTSTLNCSVEGTVKIRSDGTCSCVGGYTGDLCEELLPWYSGTYLAFRLYTTLLMSFVLVWCVLKIIHTNSKGKLRFNLVAWCIITNIIACIVRIVYVWVPSQNAGDTYEEYPFYLSWLIHVLYVSPPIMWLGSYSLLLIFWVDLVRAKLVGKFFKRLKPIVIVGYVIFFIIQTGVVFIVYYSVDTALIIGIVVLLVYMFTMATVFVVTLKCSNIPENEFPTKTRSKISQLTMNFLVGTSIYLVWSITVILYMVVVILRWGSESYMVFKFINGSFEFFFGCIILNMLDSGFGFVMIVRWLSGHKSFASRRTQSSTIQQQQQQGNIQTEFPHSNTSDPTLMIVMSSPSSMSQI
eukprot:TRINITY_DN4645_c0_g1_i1.p1 TRINITY_DN4645_c0_g1~~TRINITY_DN4645_c0_g1_i1.p1  ORF type:complete len:369 (+),score=35.15 TRINITY_DN4645_c0_g1_i1:598-1704(+)